MKLSFKNYTMLEVFDNPETDYDIWENDSLSFRAEFKIDSNRYEIICHMEFGVWDVRFENKSKAREKSMDILGTGNSQKVFSTVMMILDKFLKGHNYPSFMFFAMHKEPSRVKLYDRLSKRVMSQFASHYKYTNTDPKGKDPARKRYFFIANQDAGKKIGHWWTFSDDLFHAP